MGAVILNVVEAISVDDGKAHRAGRRAGKLVAVVRAKSDVADYGVIGRDAEVEATVSRAADNDLPGAVCPATVRNGLPMVTSLFGVIRPATRNTTVRGPVAIRAARKDPGPLSFRFVTSITAPPRPPAASAPPPCAPGKAARAPGVGLGFGGGGGGVTVPRGSPA